MISRRLGHKNPTVTLKIYAHLFEHDDTAAANAIEKVMNTTEIRDLIARQTDEDLEAAKVYVALSRLEDQGLVNAQTGTRS
jgi:DNA-binding PadR family transcriptional regulator